MNLRPNLGFFKEKSILLDRLQAFILNNIGGTGL
jgi:hypothetical protein